MAFLKKIFKGLEKLRNAFVLVIILIEALLIVLSILFTDSTLKLLESDEKFYAISIAGFVSKELEQEENKALIAALCITNDSNIISSFNEKNRTKLLKASAKVWAAIKSVGFTQFQFHIPTNNDYVTFLRVHEPQLFGEALSSFRPTIVKCNLKRTIIKGLEQGKNGYSFRAVAPVVYEGKHIGSLEVGFDFGDIFLKELNEYYPGNWGIYNLIRGVKSLDDRVIISSIGKEKDKFFPDILPDAHILSKIKKGDTYFEKDLKTETMALYIPVKDFLGDISVIVKYVYPTHFFKKLNSIIFTSVSICLIGLLISGFIILILYRRITIPIKKLVSETEKIKNFQLEDDVNISSSVTELTELIEATKSMKIGLQSFRKYVPAQLVRQLIQAKQEAKISGQRKNITIFFSDIADFTTISESLSPNELASQLSEYLSEMTDIIIKHNGTVDKYIGDAIVAFWGAPLELKDHAACACNAALECQIKIKELAVKWKNENKPLFHTRIGIMTGDIVVGNFGSAQRLSYTAIGDSVNLASRLEGLNKEYGTRIIIGQNTADKISDDFAIRLLDFVIVKGKTEPVNIYELVADKGDISAIDLEFVKAFNHGVNLYKNREWDKAIRIFTKLTSKRPDDKSIKLFIERCEALKLNPPPEAWDGEFVYKTK